MRRKTFITTVIFIFIILYISGPGYAHQMSVNVGPSKAIGEGSENINLGFSFGGYMFGEVSPNFLVGVCVAHNRWTLKSSYYYDFFLEDISMSIHEFVPTIRVSSPGSKNTDLFFQFGLGYFNLDSIMYFDSDYGVNIGGGLTIGEKKGTRFEILPVYHIVFTEGESTKYLSVNFGIVFGF